MEPSVSERREREQSRSSTGSTARSVPLRRRWRSVRRPPGSDKCALDARYPVAESVHLSGEGRVEPHPKDAPDGCRYGQNTHNILVRS